MDVIDELKQGKALNTGVLQAFDAVCHYEKHRCTAQYERLTLSTAIQPIYSIDHQRTIGFEALVRATNPVGQNVSPVDLLDMPFNDEAAIYLDRLCRYTHVANFQALSSDNCWLFLNISALASEKGCQYGAFFAELLRDFNIDPKNIVVEIIEDESTDKDKLLEAVNYYRAMGCLIAIDDFGAGHSNFERVWRLQPDIVKLDRSMILHAIECDNNLQMLCSIINLLHQANCLVVIEGVEDEHQALTAMRSGADFIQGFYFAKPQSCQQPHVEPHHLFQALSTKFVQVEQQKINQHNQYAELYINAFRELIDKLKQTHSLAEAANHLSDIAGALRCYLLDSCGAQIEKTISFKQQPSNSKFTQLQQSEKANWYRKHYVTQALKNHQRICISEPYRSITGDGLCITLSMSFYVQGKQHVVCLDISCNESD